MIFNRPTNWMQMMDAIGYPNNVVLEQYVSGIEYACRGYAEAANHESGKVAKLQAEVSKFSTSSEYHAKNASELGLKLEETEADLGASRLRAGRAEDVLVKIWLGLPPKEMAHEIEEHLHMYGLRKDCRRCGLPLVGGRGGCKGAQHGNRGCAMNNAEGV